MSWRASFDDWKTGGTMAGTVEPKIIGCCDVCGDEVTDNFVYWKDEENGVVICDDCIFKYLERIGIIQVG